MWTKVWLLLGREAELPKPGDWQMEPVGPEEILMVRQEDGGVKAFYNTHYANVPDEQLTDDFHYTLFPNFAVSLWADGFHFMRLRPHMSDPEQCLFDSWWYSSPASHDQPHSLNLLPSRTKHNPADGEAPLRMLEFGKDSMEPAPAIDEDIAVFVTQQRGFHSRGFKGVFLSNQEKRVRRNNELIDDYIYKNTGAFLER